MPQIRVGLIGGGGIASAHISGYREHAGKIGITAVADAVEQTAVDRGGELGAAPYTDYRLMLEAEDLDAVDICLPRSGKTETFDLEPVNTFVAEIGHFADSLLTKTRPLHTEDEGIAVLGILLAAYEGARTKTIAPVLKP